MNNLKLLNDGINYKKATLEEVLLDAEFAPTALLLEAVVFLFNAFVPKAELLEPELLDKEPFPYFVFPLMFIIIVNNIFFK